MIVHLVRRNAKSVPWVAEETLAPIRKQDSIGHDVGPRTSKSSSPSEDLGSMILKGYCGAKRFYRLWPIPFQPKIHAEEEEVSEDGRRESILPECTADDDPIFGKPKSQDRKVPRCPRQSP